MRLCRLKNTAEPHFLFYMYFENNFQNLLEIGEGTGYTKGDRPRMPEKKERVYGHGNTK